MTNPKGYVTYAKRADLPYVVLKKFNPDLDTPNFIRVFSDGSWTGHDSKRIGSEVVDHGSSLKELD